MSKWFRPPATPGGMLPNLGLPLANNMRLLVAPGLFNNGIGGTTGLIPAYINIGAQPESLKLGSGGCTFASTQQGVVAVPVSGSNISTTITATGVIGTVNVTFLILYRANNTSYPNTQYLKFSGNGTTDLVELYLPYLDGTCYWDFGGGSGINRVTAAGLTYTNWAVYVVTAGHLGMQIYQNGIQVGSSATAVTRTDGTIDVLSFAANSLSSFLPQTALFAMFDANWDSSFAREASANPWQLFAPVRLGPKFFIPTVSAGGLSAIGSSGGFGGGIGASYAGSAS